MASASAASPLTLRNGSFVDSKAKTFCEQVSWTLFSDSNKHRCKAATMPKFED